ncbi:MAG: ribose 5-phosphate isomerase A [Deltaproteobacteria bacterium]|nr:ribose 5-phosphate isomerase A [Deltaproteobacteria bacterium]
MARTFAPTTDPDALRAAREVADAVPDRSVLGLGTGTTFAAILVRLGERIASEGLRISGVPTSEATAEQARQIGIALVSPRPLSLAIDGADEVDPEGNLLKGGGGALVREKIVAQSAKELWIVVSPKKLVPRLGATFRLPIEIVRFGHELTVERIARLLPDATLRTKDGQPVESDNGGYLVDATLESAPTMRLADALKSIVGVVDHGLFLRVAPTVVWVGREGRVERLDLRA